jgi:hypothetical protein
MASNTGEDSDVRDKAERLLEVANVVQSSNNERNSLLAAMVNFAADGGLENFEDSAASLEAVTLLAEAHKVPQNTQGGTIPSRSGHASTERRSGTVTPTSRSQTIAELKKQLQDSHKALLTMQENANLKYRKLELQAVELKTTFEKTQKELAITTEQLEKVSREKAQIAESLEKAVGKGHADLIVSLERKNIEAKDKLTEVSRERDDAIKEGDIMRKAMSACSLCSHKIPKNIEMHRDSLSRSFSETATSFWNTVSIALIGLNDEAKFTSAPLPKEPLTTGSSPTSESKLHFKAQSTQIKRDLEADIEEMEKEMKQDIEALKKEWATPPSRVVPNGRKRYHEKKSRSRSTGNPNSVIAGISSLDAFFASATHGLEDEEMDEEKSFFSKSRSVATAPAATQRRKKKKKRSSHKASGASDDEGGNDDNSTDIRAQFRKTLSFRQNLRAKLLGLEEEVTTETSPFVQASSPEVSESKEEGKNETDRFHGLQKEVAEWGGTGAARNIVTMV